MTNEELLNSVVTIWNQKQSGLLSEEAAFEDYRSLCDAFDARYGEGSARAVITRSPDYQRTPVWVAAALRGLGPESGNLEQWLNASDAAFMKSIGISL